MESYKSIGANVTIHDFIRSPFEGDQVPDYDARQEEFCETRPIMSYPRRLEDEQSSVEGPRDERQQQESENYSSSQLGRKHSPIPSETRPLRHLPLGPSHSKADWLRYEDWLKRRKEYREKQDFNFFSLWRASESRMSRARHSNSVLRETNRSDFSSERRYDLDYSNSRKKQRRRLKSSDNYCGLMKDDSRHPSETSSLISDRKKNKCHRSRYPSLPSSRSLSSSYDTERRSRATKYYKKRKNKKSKHKRHHHHHHHRHHRRHSPFSSSSSSNLSLDTSSETALAMRKRRKKTSSGKHKGKRHHSVLSGRKLSRHHESCKQSKITELEIPVPTSSSSQDSSLHDSNSCGSNARRRKSEGRLPSTHVDQSVGDSELSGVHASGDLVNSDNDISNSVSASKSLKSTTAVQENLTKKHTFHNEEDDDDDLPGPKPLEANEKLSRQSLNYGGALRPGEGEAMAQFVQTGKRIPRRGEVGLTADEIEAFERLGYVMSGSRHRRMNAVRIRKENQVYSAEEQRALAMYSYEERANRDAQLIADLKEMLKQQNERFLNESMQEKIAQLKSQDQETDT